MKIIDKNKERSVAKTFMFSYAIIILICMVVITIITVRYENIVQKENDELNKYFFSSVSQSVGSALDNTQNLQKKITEEKTILSITQNQTAQKNYWKTQTAIDAVEQLKNFSEEYRTVDLIFIYLKLTDEVVSQHGIIGSDVFYNLYFEEAGISYEEWITILKENTKSNYINLNCSLKRGRVESLAFLSPVSTEKNAVSVIVMDKNNFLSDIKKYDEKNRFDVYIYNSFQRLIYYETNNNAKEIPHTVDEMEKLIAKDKNSIYTMAQPSLSEQWYIATSIPKTVMGSKILLVRIIIIISVMFALIILFMLIKYFIRRDMEYISKVSSILKINKKGNEYHEVFQSVEQLLEENRSLRKEQIKNEANLKQMLLAGKFKGNNGHTSQKAKSSLPLYGNCFCVILFYLEDISTVLAEENMDEEKRREYYRFIIQNVYEEAYDAPISTYACEVDGMMVCLVNLKEATEENYNNFKKIAQERLTFINIKFNLDLSYVLSDMFYGEEKIPDAYAKTLEALEYKKNMGIKECIIYSDISFDYTEGYLFNEEKENKLIRDMRAGKKKDAVNAVETIFRILENNHKFSREYKTYVAQDVLRVITKTAFSVISEEKIMKKGNSLDKNAQSRPIEETHKLTIKWLEEVCDLMLSTKDKKMKRKSELIENVIKYVETNYGNSLLNTALIGDHFKLSPYYLSRLFKEETGVSLTDYINKCRVVKAKELMENSDFSSAEIAEKVGFYHVRTYYRVLKKYIMDIDE